MATSPTIFFEIAFLAIAGPLSLSIFLMTFDETMREIARLAAEGSRVAMRKLGQGKIKHEDDLTGALA